MTLSLQLLLRCRNFFYCLPPDLENIIIEGWNHFHFQAKLETKALKAKRPGFTDDRYNETSYYCENGKSYNVEMERIIILCVFRSAEGLPLLLYIHHIHQRSVGWRKNSRCFRSGISCSSSRGIRKFNNV